MPRGCRDWAFAVAFVAAVGCGSSPASSVGGTESSAPAPSSNDAPAATRATGEVGEWQSLEALPTPRANHCSVVANGFLVVIGGNYKPSGKADFVDLDDVVVAKIADDGTLGSWKVAGRAPSALNSCTVASDGKDVFLLDAIFANDAIGKIVRRATLSPDGVLGQWQEVGPLPKGARVLFSVASVSNGTLRALRAKLPDEGDAVSLLTAPLDGLSWTEAKLSAGFRGRPQFAISDSHVFALGGYAGPDNAVSADGAGAALDPSGAPGKPVSITAMPKPTSFGQAVIVDDWMFVVGGKSKIFGEAGRADVFAGKISADGSISSWSSVTALPQGRTSHSLARSGDFVYVTGGGYDAGGLATVFGARVRFSP